MAGNGRVGRSTVAPPPHRRRQCQRLAKLEPACSSARPIRTSHRLKGSCSQLRICFYQYSPDVRPVNCDASADLYRPTQGAGSLLEGVKSGTAGSSEIQNNKERCPAGGRHLTAAYGGGPQVRCPLLAPPTPCCQPAECARYFFNVSCALPAALLQGAATRARRCCPPRARPASGSLFGNCRCGCASHEASSGSRRGHRPNKRTQ